MTGAPQPQIEMRHRYRLIDEDDNDLGPFLSHKADWQPGQTIPLRPGQDLEIVNVVPSDEPNDLHAYLIVRRA